MLNFILGERMNKSIIENKIEKNIKKICEEIVDSYSRLNSIIGKAALVCLFCILLLDLFKESNNILYLFFLNLFAILIPFAAYAPIFYFVALFVAVIIVGQKSYYEKSIPDK